MTQEQITDYLLRVVQPQLQTLNGVSQAPIFGEREYAMRLNMDPGLMAAHNVTPNDVFNAITFYSRSAFSFAKAAYCSPI